MWLLKGAALLGPSPWAMPNVRAVAPGARVEDLPLLNAPELEDEVRAAGFESPCSAQAFHLSLRAAEG